MYNCNYKDINLLFIGVFPDVSVGVRDLIRCWRALISELGGAEAFIDEGVIGSDFLPIHCG